MDIVELREYCLSLPGVTESFPFDNTTLVFKVGGKIFALVSLEGKLFVNLKCDPELAIQLREEYWFVNPGYHMDKRHWNTIDINSPVDTSLLKSWVDHSYKLVYDKLTKSARIMLNPGI